MDGSDGFRWTVSREGLCSRQVEGRGFHGVVSMGKRSLGGFNSPWHFCGPPLTWSLHLFFLVICSRLFHKCSRALWLLSDFSHFEDSKSLLQSPWAPIYIPLPRGPQHYASWDQQLTSPANGGPGWELTSENAILTPLEQNGGQLRWFDGENAAFLMALRRPPNSPAILICLSQLCWVTRQETCVSSKPCPTAIVLRLCLLFSRIFHHYLDFKILPKIPPW